MVHGLAQLTQEGTQIPLYTSSILSAVGLVFSVGLVQLLKTEKCPLDVLTDSVVLVVLAVG